MNRNTVRQTNVVQRYEDFLEQLREHERFTRVKFVSLKTPASFKKAELILSEKQRLHWFNDTPYYHFGTKVFGCHQGSDHHKAAKIKYRLAVDEKEKYNPDSVKRYKRIKPTKKVDCPATISVTRAVIFHAYKLDAVTDYHKAETSKAVRRTGMAGELVGEECFMFNLPSEEDHANHLVGSDALSVEPVKKRKKPYEVFVIQDGFSRLIDDKTMEANCTCTLLKGRYNIIIDTMTAWDRDVIIDGLDKHNLTCDDINYVISTHGHSDHIGNNNLFLKATLHIVGFSINNRDKYTIHSFDSGEPFIIDKEVSVIPTPGHTSEDVSVIVKTKEGIVAVTGDLFEREEDLMDSTIWREMAGSQNPEEQEKNRQKILQLADFVIPGHGPKFKVPLVFKNKSSVV